MLSSSKISTQTLAQIVFYGIPFVFSFALIKILIVFFGEADYALYVVAFGAALVARILVYNTAQSVFLRYFGLSEFRVATLVQLRRFMLMFLFAPAGVALIAATGFCTGLLASVSQEFVILLYGFLLGCGLGGIGVISEIDNAHYSRPIGGAMILAVPVVQTLLVPVAASFGIGIVGYLMGASLSLLICASFYATNFLGRALSATELSGSWSEKLPLPVGFIAFIRQLSYWVVPTLLLKAADRFVVANFFTVLELAAFGVCLMLTERIYAASATVFSRVYNRKIYANLGSEDRSSNHRAVDGLVIVQLLIAAVLTVFYAFFGEFVLLSVASREIANQSTLLTSLALTMGVMAAMHVQVLHGHIEGRPNPFLIVRILTGATYLSILLVLGPEKRVDGLIMATVASAVVAVLTSMVATRCVRASPAVRANA